MTIYLYTGTPGAGKSLHMAEQIYWDVRRGAPVVCNFDINIDMFEDSSSFTLVENDELTPSRLAEISRAYFEDKPIKEGAIRLFVDECQILFNARNWNSPLRAQWIKFFTQHRKLGYDIYLITQYDTMLDKQIRALVEYEIKHRKLNNVGWVGKLTSVVMLGHPVIIGVMYWYPMKQRLKALWYIGRKKYYSLYDTYVIFSGQEIDSKQLVSLT